MRIWNEWADENGDLGPVYGKQWRSWTSPDGEVIDQIKQVIHLLKNDPNSRRIIVNAWNVGELKDMALSPCHALFQFYVSNGALIMSAISTFSGLLLGCSFQYCLLRY